MLFYMHFLYNVNDMNTSLIVCGGEKSERFEKAWELALSFSKREDILILDTTKERGINDTRNLTLKLSKKPYGSMFLTAIISEAQNLTLEAQNSILKVLEEPSSTSQLILTMPSEFSLLSTISSRCQKIHLKSETNSKSELPESILSSNISDRLDLSEKLDLEDWTLYLREGLRKLVIGRNDSKDLLKNLVKYLRLVERIQRHKQISNPKLSRYFAIITIPKGLELLASGKRI